MARDIPRPERGLHALIAAVGRAAQRMPKLTSLFIELDGSSGLFFGLVFGNCLLCEGGRQFLKAGERNEFRFSWYINPPARLGDEVVEAWGLRWGEVEVREGRGVEGKMGEEEGWWSAAAVVPWR